MDENVKTLLDKFSGVSMCTGVRKFKFLSDGRIFLNIVMKLPLL
jgi:hypothetical protein